MTLRPVRHVLDAYVADLARRIDGHSSHANEDACARIRSRVKLDALWSAGTATAEQQSALFDRGMA